MTGVKWLIQEAAHSAVLSAEVGNKWSYTSTGIWGE